MQLLVFRALWGMSGTLPQQIEQIAAAGYDGVEIWPFGQTTRFSRREWASLLQPYALKVIVAARVVEKTELASTLAALSEFEPLKINLHSGRDAMTHEAGLEFFEEALRIEAQIGYPVAHETHRGCAFFTPWDSAFYLRHFETLKLTADYSHWVNVCERFPDDQAEALDLANRRAIHIHGRVGYAEGPQVPDPSAPEYAEALAWHEAQWQIIRTHRRDADDPILTFTPEYGPPRYLHTLPHTDAPVADLWRVCLWAANRARSTLW